MRERAAVPPALAGLCVMATAAVLAVLLSGCSPDAPRKAPVATPALGGPAVVRSSPPGHAMNRLERPVAAQLARRVARQGLTLSYLDCPRWDGAVPRHMHCRAYVDGLVAQVDVLLSKAVRGRAVGFDARLEEGVIATRNLEATLRRQGWHTVACGDTAAYPARVGTQVVCRVTRSTTSRYLVATVRSRGGQVTITDYRSAGARQ